MCIISQCALADAKKILKGPDAITVKYVLSAHGRAT